jgi:hypothetical protein
MADGLHSPRKMRLRSKAIAVFVAVTGCSTSNGVQGTHDGVDASEAGAGVFTGPDAATEAEAGASTGPDAAATEAGSGVAHIVVKNSTATLLNVYLAEYLGGVPQWLHIGAPELPLIGFGGSLCADGSHYDPIFLTVNVPAGGEVRYDWDGAYMTTTGPTGCWATAYAPSGRYPAKACAYTYGADAGVQPSNGTGPFSDGGAATCVDLTVTLPASGEALSTASWQGSPCDGTDAGTSQCLLRDSGVPPDASE